MISPEVRAIYQASEKVVAREGNLELERTFSYHAPTPDMLPKFEAIRHHAKCFAYMLHELVTDCKERTIAVNMIESAVMWANAGIARNTIQMGVGTPPPLPGEAEELLKAELGQYTGQQIREASIAKIDEAITAMGGHRVEVCPACLRVKDENGCGCTSLGSAVKASS